MNLHHLKYFYDAASAGQISEAAKANYVSQSAVSQAIKTLELELDCQLTLHGRRSFELTDAGHTLFKKCQAVFDSVLHLRQEMAQLQIAHSGEIVVGTTASYAINQLGPLLKVLRKRFPLLRVRLRIGNSELLRDWLINRHVDLALMVGDGKKDKKLKSRVLSRGRYVVVRSKKDRSVPHLSGLMVTRASRPEVKAWVKKYRQTYGYNVPIVQEIVSWQVIQKFVKLKLGHGLVPDYVVADDLKKKELKVVKLRFDPVTYELIIVTRRSSIASKNLTAVLDVIFNM